MRERFLRSNFENFAPHELIEMLLFYVIPIKNTNVTAHALLNKFVDIHRIFETDTDEISKVDGISYNSALFLKICGDVCNYYLNTDEFTTNSENIDEYVRRYLFNVKSEVFLIISVDKKMNVKGVYTLPFDAFQDKKIMPRNLAEIILKNKIYEIVLAHKHINRPAVPDMDDYRTVKCVREIVSPLNVTVRDYIISDDNTTFSMYKRGCI